MSFSTFVARLSRPPLLPRLSQDLNLKGLTSSHSKQAIVHPDVLAINPGKEFTDHKFAPRTVLSGDFNGAHFFRATLREVNGARGSFKGARLDNADLSGGVFTRANFEGANLDGSNLTRTDLTGANLRGASFRNTVMEGTKLAGADLEGAEFIDTHIHPGIDLSNASLRNAKMRYGSLSGNCDGLDLRGTDLRGARIPLDLRKARFGEGTDLRDVNRYLGGLNNVRLPWYFEFLVMLGKVKVDDDFGDINPFVFLTLFR